MSKSKLLCFLSLFAFQACRAAEENLPARHVEARAQLAVPKDGFHTARVITSVGEFERPVMLKDGIINCIKWKDSSCSPFLGKNHLDGSSSGMLENGLVAKLELVD